MENLRKYSNTQSVVAYVVANKLDAHSLGIVVNKPNGDFGSSAWFVLTFRSKVSPELEEAVGKEKALQYADRQEVRVVGKNLLPKLKTLLSGDEGAKLYNKLANYPEGEQISEAEAQAVLTAFIQLIKEDKLAISLLTEIDGEGNLLPTRPVAHLRGSGASAEVSNLTW